MVVYNHFGSFITLSPKIARDLALRACGFLRKVGRILRQGSELRENAIDWRFDCSFGRLLPYSRSRPCWSDALRKAASKRPQRIHRSH
jgi:hypothetical protein